MDSNPITDEIRKYAREFSKNYKSKSAIDEERANESKDFSKTAQEKFGGDERGSEDLIDMYEKGAFDS